MLKPELTMCHIFLALCASTLVYASVLHPQTSTRTNEQQNASYEAHKGDFDYLLGDWEFSAKSHEHGTYHGLWSAVRLAEGQILACRISGRRAASALKCTSSKSLASAAIAPPP